RRRFYRLRCRLTYGPPARKWMTTLYLECAPVFWTRSFVKLLDQFFVRLGFGSDLDKLLGRKTGLFQKSLINRTRVYVITNRALGFSPGLVRDPGEPGDISKADVASSRLPFGHRAYSFRHMDFTSRFLE